MIAPQPTLIAGLDRHTAAQRAGNAVTRAMRVMLLVAGAFVVIAGLQLFLLTDRTDGYFAWTVEPPLTAAFLGAGYWAAAVLQIASARRSEWTRARLAMPAVLFFTTMTLAVTLIHLSRFHLHSVFGIGWVAVYVGFPPAMAAVLTDQLRSVCATTARSTRLPALTRTVLILQAVVMASLGIALLVAPGHAAPLWPWPLTPLTGQAIGAWLAGVAFLAAHVVWEDSCERADVAMLSYATFGVLQLVALARYPSTLNWGPAAAAYLTFLAGMIAVGVDTWIRGRRAIGALTSEPPHLISHTPPERAPAAPPG